MKGSIIFIGFVVLVAGICIAFSNPIRIDHPKHCEPIEPGSPVYVCYPEWTETIYPYAVAGGIVCLIGVITAIIGWAMPESESRVSKAMRELGNDSDAISCSKCMFFGDDAIAPCPLGQKNPQASICAYYQEKRETSNIKHT